MRTVTSSKRIYLLSIAILIIAGALLLARFLFPGSGSSSADVQAPIGNSGPVALQLLGITDFHGYLRAYNDSSNGRINSPNGQIIVGGGAYNAAHLKRLREGRENSLLLSVGDNFSGWPFEVDAFRNEPTIEFLNAIGVDVSVAGNHEFDVSADFLTQHMKQGICFGTRDVDSCFTDSSGRPFHGSDFDYISANVHDVQSGKLLLKPYVIKQIKDGRGGTIPVGIIGLTTAAAFTKEPMSFQAGALMTDGPPEPNQSLPSDPMASALLEPANRYAKELQDQGIQTIIVLLHDGGSHSSSYNNCVRPQGPAIDFAKYASPSIDVILAGHWHTAFNCSVNDPDGKPRPVIEGSNHGRIIMEVNLAIDPVTKDVIRDKTVAVNHPVTRDVPADPEIGKMALYWIDRGKVKAAEPVAELTGNLTRDRNEHGESTLADVVADAFYAAVKANGSQPADFALTKGDRKRDLLYSKGSNSADRDGLLLFGELTEADGTHDSTVVVTLTGQQIDQVLEEQWSKRPDGMVTFNPLNVSYNVHYTYDRSKPIGERIDPANVSINGESLDPGRSYRIATNGEIAANGGGYPSFFNYSSATRAASWPVLEYMRNQKVIQVPKLDRVRSIGQ